jgi:NADH-quinone oxidoreductase subunit N
VASKAAGLAALVVLFVIGFADESVNWVPYAVVLSVATMVVGNVFALAQTNVKRLFGYSGIAHAGYLLMALVAWETSGIAMLLFYLAAYVVMNTGTFLVVEAVSRDGDEDRVANFDGLARRSPWLGMAMLLFLLSLAGIPFVVGFWAKLYLFVAVWQAGYPWLVLVGAALALVGLFYYLQVVRAIYMKPPAEGHTDPIKPGFGLSVSILICLIGVVAFGVWPGLLLESAEAAAMMLVK